MIKQLAVIVFSILGCMTAAAKAETFAAQEFFLPNGLQVVVIENHKAPIVQQMLFYKSGSADEATGKGGIAHLLEHLMFRGTAKVKGQRFNRILEENGAESNAFTSHDVTVYHQLADISRLELVMFLEADRMQGLKISEADFATERDIVYQERKQRVDNNPAAQFFEKVRAVLWQQHPYGRPVTGQDTEIMNLSRKDAQDYYRRHYAPNNAVLVLAGDIDLPAAKQLADRYYGDLKPAAVPETPFVRQKAGGYKARVEMSLPEVRLGRFVKMFMAPSFVTDVRQAYALEILSEYLAGDENAPLYQRLVLKDKAALSVNVSYNGTARDLGSFAVSVVPAAEKIDAGFEKKADKAWAEALAALTEDRLAEVKQKILARLVFLKDNPADMAQIAGIMSAVGVKPEDWKNYAEDLQRVSLSEVKQAADDLWQRAPQVTGILQPEENKE